MSVSLASLVCKAIRLSEVSCVPPTRCACYRKERRNVEANQDGHLRNSSRDPFLECKRNNGSRNSPSNCDVYGERAMSDSMVRRWVRLFNEGRENVHDDERSGRPALVNDDMVRAIEEKIRGNRRFTITSLSEHFPEISRSLLHEIVSETLGYRKLCARWVPKQLTEEHKMKRRTSAMTFLNRLRDQEEDFLNQIATGDETWVSHATPETKRQSMEWRHTSSPVKTKFKQTLSIRKIMCIVFWDRKVLLVEFMAQGTTINSALGHELHEQNSFPVPEDNPPDLPNGKRLLEFCLDG